MTDENLDPSPSRTTLQSYLRILRRQWWVPLVVTAVALTAAVIYTQRATPEYSASMKIVVGQGRALFGADASGAFQPFTQTMTDLLRSDVVARRTIAERALDDSPQQLLERLSVTTNPETSVLQVTLRGTDRAEATATLTAIGDIFVSLIDENLSDLGADPTGTTGATGTTGVRPPTAAQADAVSATVFDPAHGNPDQVSPHVKRTLVFALLLGLVSGVLLAFLRDALSSGIQGEEAAEAFGATILAPLPSGVLGTKPNEVVFLPPRIAERVSESVQLLAASLRYAGGPQGGGVVVVTSARPEDGKTSVVAHLSAALSDAGAWVVAVEADLHKPALHRMFDVAPDGAGLTDVLSGRVTAEQALVIVPRPVPEKKAVAASGGDALPAPSARLSKLELLAAGRKHHRPAELLSLGSTGAMLNHLRELVEWIVVDTPPVLLSGDAFPLLQLADHVIVVCREGQTTREEAQAVKARMVSLGVERYSVVVTDSSEASHRAYGYSDATDRAS